MTNARLLKIGVFGSVVTAICCFTPVLVLALAAIGAASLVGVLDYVLVPSLAIFLLITGYALWKRQRRA